MAESTKHELFVSYDFAIITIEEPFKWLNDHDHVNAICLPFGFDFSAIDNWLNFEPFTITGWGETNDNGVLSERLQFASMLSYPSYKCFEFYYAPGTQIPSPHYLNMTFCLIAKDHNDDSATCFGDKGGPALWEDTQDKERAYLFGKAVLKLKITPNNN